MSKEEYWVEVLDDYVDEIRQFIANERISLEVNVEEAVGKSNYNEVCAGVLSALIYLTEVEIKMVKLLTEYKESEG